MAKSSGGRRFSKTCLVKGREAEGRKAILKRFPKHTRVAPIREDGFTDDGGEKVPTSRIIDVRPVDEAPTLPGPLSGVVGDAEPSSCRPLFGAVTAWRPDPPLFLRSGKEWW